MQGRFITFEGGEGAGKSTQIRRLHDRLAALGIDVVVTREPGGSPGAEFIRDLLLSGGARGLGPRGEAMLFAAARADHVDATIRPALEAGKWVLCDRFADSTRVYQGEAGVDAHLLGLLETAATLDLRPDLTVLIDVPADVGLKRVAARSRNAGADRGPDRFEDEALGVHERRRALFLELARDEPERIRIVDGSGDAAEVEAAVWAAVSERFGLERSAPRRKRREAADGARG
ncbi:dTMP kinase [Polymorphum gilvum]|uniref:Thymidylate kinase n=1 Tax=Polymorphum gilvum (strain LMG 25793 / CGMCC 1.9160 / SL003B-26A1) TaxID=991905 RepID=F2IZX9_POLGS|nr:dTMP kinase [Polymorphum gilvum]ADZ70705.1 Thymidylate kinase [Polymorphum gilvum SL003B-26A1]